MIPVVMTVAGSDSSAGAGIQADLKTFSALGVYGATVVTAVTAQDTACVHEVFVLPPEMIGRQMEVVVSDLSPATVKVGMLGNQAAVEVVSRTLRKLAIKDVVLDPVLAATGGMSLLDPGGIHLLRTDLLKACSVVTPNMAEAAMLTNRTVTDLGGMKEAARALHGMGAASVLVTGGHLPGEEAIDVFYDGGSFAELNRPRVPKSPHGTGCVLSAAIAAHLAWGRDLREAVAEAARFIGKAIAQGRAVGQCDVCDPSAH
jgi:hydroxymethylpyrimidine/phosphomethylpyrimidine kinase